MAEAIRQRLPETTPAYPKANRPEAGVFITGHRPPLIGGQESPRQSIRGKKLTNVYELSVTMNYRLFFQKTSDTYILLAIGTHKEILGR